MFLLFATLIGPILLFLLTWVVATVYRLYFPERPLPFRHDPVVQREKAAAAGEAVPVGLREIRADQRRTHRQRDDEYRYVAGSLSNGLPEAWEEDLWRRRN